MEKRIFVEVNDSNMSIFMTLRCSKKVCRSTLTVRSGSEFFCFENNKNKLSLYQILKLLERHIARNTLIYSDEWRAYIGLEQLGYEHKTVNHQEFIINPKDGANTQQIEAFWNRLRFRMVRQMRHFTVTELPKYMAFYWFLSLHYNPIKGSYPPDLLEIYLRALSQIYII
ncbi:hypothetical protein ACQ4LE_008399 [Meloidogyne hapla]